MLFEAPINQTFDTLLAINLVVAINNDNMCLLLCKAWNTCLEPNRSYVHSHLSQHFSYQIYKQTHTSESQMAINVFHVVNFISMFNKIILLLKKCQFATSLCNYEIITTNIYN